MVIKQSFPSLATLILGGIGGGGKILQIESILKGCGGDQIINQVE